MIVDCTLKASDPLYYVAQFETGRKLREAGFEIINWLMSESGNYHTWRVKCNEEGLTTLKLMCTRVSLEYNRKKEAELYDLQVQLAEMNARIKELTRELNC